MKKNSLVGAFKDLIGAENVMESETDRMNYSYDAAVLAPVMPGLVVRPRNTEDIGAILKLCNENNIPVTVRGAGTNLSGGTIPSMGGLVMLTNGLQRIIEINEADMYAIVEPGVITAQLAAEVSAKGLFYPPDPGSQTVSTIAGNVAENAGGLRGLKYGVTKDYVMGMEFYDATGTHVRTGSKTVKCVTGFNLAGLMTASEGCFGVYSQITLKLVPPPKASRSMMAVYDSVDKAAETVAAIIAAKIIPCTLEFMDNFTIRTVEDFAKVGLPTEAKALLLIEVDGHPAQVEDEAAEVETICKANGASRIQVAQNAEERNKVWEARRTALSALAKLRPTTVLEDATVPRSRIPDMVRGLDAIAARHKLTIGTFGHAGDGNLHPTILCDKRDREEWHRVEKGVEEIFELALGMGGTLSGEHGIGLAKAGFMEKEIGRGSIEFSRKIKRAVDPKNILNPGKIIGG
ncbi:FAD-binding oxidoreductase [Desulfobotulus mexicanus]|uniref:FAD-binding protein n=1 Tax=Desulfobotulus mexicanus TaxID=2586642 RepID=A0A5Q4VHS5_9BACT|nr:FAD-linked oxidase C-terminal domain-containing protein [Desulfobotulus mexicanus]TYT75730.1 FAD-binding protein [Desulfobotulus mexicanus]